MDINGNQIVKGTGPSLITTLADATDTGAGSNNKKWVITFPNGIKIQSDTIEVGSNTTANFVLPEAYTEKHYTVIVSIAASVGTSADNLCVHAEIPSGAENLTHVQLENINNTARDFSYISIGKDTK